MFEEQEAKSQAGKLQDGSVAKEGKTGKKKDKGGAAILQPPLKRSVKGDPTGALLPPPLISAPLKHPASIFTSAPQAVLGSVLPTPPKSEASTSQEAVPGTRASAPDSRAFKSYPALPTGQQQPSESNSSRPASSIPAIPPSLFIPIVVGPIPASHPSSSESPNLAGPLTSTPIVLHDGMLILNPDVFSHLTTEQVKELEALGAQKALQILQSYIARFLKEQRLKKRDSGRGRGRGRGVLKRGRGGGRKPEDGNCPAGETTHGSADDKLAKGPFTMTPLPRRTSHPRPVDNPEDIPVPDTHPPSSGATPVIVDAKPPVPIPVAGNNAAPVGDEEDAEPIIIVDDSDTLEEPAAKKRRLEVNTIFAAGPGTI